MKTYKLTIKVELTESEALRLQRMARLRGISSKQQAADIVKQSVLDSDEFAFDFHESPFKHTHHRGPCHV